MTERPADEEIVAAAQRGEPVADLLEGPTCNCTGKVHAIGSAEARLTGCVLNLLDGWSE